MSCDILCELGDITSGFISLFATFFLRLLDKLNQKENRCDKSCLPSVIVGLCADLFGRLPRLLPVLYWFGSLHRRHRKSGHRRPLPSAVRLAWRHERWGRCERFRSSSGSGRPAANASHRQQRSVDVPRRDDGRHERYRRLRKQTDKARRAVGVGERPCRRTRFDDSRGQSVLFERTRSLRLLFREGDAGNAAQGHSRKTGRRKRNGRIAFTTSPHPVYSSFSIDWSEVVKKSD